MTGTAREFLISREKNKTSEDIADKDRKSREKVANDDRRSREKVADKDRRQKKESSYVQAGSNVVGGMLKMLNSPEWYKNYTNNMAAFTSIPTYTRLGDPIASKFGLIPGICVLRWFSTVGPQPNVKDFNVSSNPVNQILMRSKEQILKLNSRSNVNWEGADLGLNFYAARELYAIILEVQRVIGVALKFDGENLFMGDSLIEALGFSAPDFRANLPKYKASFEIWRMRFNKAIIAPKSLTLYDRTKFLASTIFIDSPTASMHQTYAYVHRPDLWLCLSDLGDKCERVANPMGAKDLYTYVQIDRIISMMFQRLTENPDFISMFSDLRNAFGDDLVQIEAIPMDYEVPIVYNEEILLQFKNTVTLPVQSGAPYIVGGGAQLFKPKSIDICSLDNGYLFQGDFASGVTGRISFVSDPFTATEAFANKMVEYVKTKTAISLIDSKNYNFADQFLVNTRNMSNYTLTYLSDKTLLAQFTSCGTEGFTDFTVRLRSHKGSADEAMIDSLGTYTYGPDDADAATVFDSLSDRISMVSKFDWMAPVVFVGSGTHDISIAEWNKYVNVELSQIDQLHTICVLSELYLQPPKFK